MNIVLPMAGHGQRFRREYSHTPKMLIDVCRRPMFYWALDSLKKNFSLENIIFVCLENHINQYALNRYIYAYEKQARIKTITTVLNGQAESVYAAKDMLNMNDSLLIYNCDTYTVSHIAEGINKLNADGIISVFYSDDPTLSYVKLNDEINVTSIIEKRRVSPYASTGLYYFAKTRLFIEAVEKVREIIPHYEEMYIANIYNYLIEKGYNFHIHKASQCYPLGTPDHVKKFIQLTFNEGTERRGWRI